ncbi:MAG TPA: MG2 domain-containing protein [Armatimonadota bacterium]|nr:MG2 domain-containing protein [Armatimonadota bacterium]
MAAEAQAWERWEAGSRFRTLAVVACAVWAAGLLALFASRQVPMGEIRGRVTAEDTGQPVPKAKLLLALASPSVPGRKRQLLVDERGYFHLRRIPAGEYFVSASSRAHRLPPTRLTIAEGRATEVALELAPTTPFLDVYVPQHVFVPDEPVQITAHGFTREDALTVEAYRVDPLRVMREARGSLWRALVPNAASDAFGPEERVALRQVAGAAPVARFSHVPARDGEGVFTQRITLPLKDPGLYVVACQGDGMERIDWVMVTGLGLITKRSGSRVLAFAVDLATGEPAPGTEIRVYAEDGERQSMVADEQGIASFQAGESDLLLAARRGNSMAFIRLWGSGAQESGEQQRVFLYTDRPVYRPGARVRFKGIARAVRGEEFLVPEGKPVRVEVHDPRGTLIYAAERMTNDFGSFHGELELSPEASTGTYTLSAEWGGQRHDEYFDVAAYRKPEYQVEVIPERAEYTRSESGWVTIEARYYFGAPVAGARVDYVIMRSPIWSWQEEDAEYLPYGDQTGEGEVVATGVATTDARGRCRVRFETATPELATGEEAGLDWESFDHRYSIEATVFDQGRFSATGSARVKVWRGEHTLEVEPGRFVAGAGEEIPVTARVRDRAGAPLEGVDVELRFVRRDWNDEGFTLVSVGKSRGASDAEGQVKARFQAPSAGSYQLVGHTRDKRGNRITATAYLWVSGPGGGSAHARLPDLQVIPDRREYQPGDEATFLIQTSRPGGTALVAIETDRLLDWRLVPLKERSIPFRMRVTREHLPNFTLSVCTVRDKEMALQEAGVNVSSRPRALRVEVTPDREVYAPGERATYQVRVRDANGRPVQAELSLGVVDESIYAIQEDRADILRAFYPRRASLVETSFSFPQIYLSGADKGGPAESVRKEFPDTALWVPVARTNAQGEATVALAVPDSLTTWRATVRAHTRETLVGQAVSRITCRKELMVRIQAPRFLTARDEVTLSAMVHNESDATQRVRVSLDAEGALPAGARETAITLRPGQARRLDWKASVQEAGDCRLVARARAESGLTDAVEVRLPVLPHGRVRAESRSGSLSGDGVAEEKIRLRSDVLKQTKVTLHLSPSLASGMLSALSFLATYPYGCTEQTMSAFLPDLLVHRTLSRLGARSPEMAKHLEREIPKMVDAGLQRLYRYQHLDGGWGWWEHDESEPEMTAYVVEGLVLARKAGFRINERALTHGVEWLREREVTRIARERGISSSRAAQLMAQARASGVPGLALAAPTAYRASNLGVERATVLHALALAGEGGPIRLVLGGQTGARATRESGTLARLALAARRAGLVAEAESLCRRLVARSSESANFCHWNSDAETTALALQAILAVPGEPRDERMAVAAKAVRWLLSRREDGYWGSTQATARVLFALVEYLEATGETAPAFTVTPAVNGQALEPVRFDARSLFQPEVTITLPASALRAGENQITLRKQGAGSLYYTVRAREFVTQEEIPVLVGGAGIAVTRTYHRLRSDRDPKDGTLRLMPSPRPVEHLRAGETYLSRLTIRSPRRYEHVVIEEPLPAGCEPLVRERTGEGEWNRWWTHVETRDHQIAFFARQLDAGERVLEYHFRASVPGEYHVMPAVIQGMYDPEVRAGGAETRVEVR